MTTGCKLKTKTKKRFAKDCKLPITIYKEPYFDYYIDQYEDYLGSKTKYREFQELIYALGEDKFFDESSKIVADAIQYAKDAEGWDRFNTCNMSMIMEDKIPITNPVSASRNIYSKQFDGLNFVSIDLVKANFQSINYFDQSILNAETYEDYLGRFTNFDYYKKSKQIRQVIFGNLSPKRQQIIQKRISASIAARLAWHGWKVQSITSDEVVVILSHDTDLQMAVESVSSIIDERFSFDVTVKGFALKTIEESEYFVKEYLDGSYELKGIPSHYFAEVFKVYNGLDIISPDRKTFWDGRIVSFDDPLFGWPDSDTEESNPKGRKTTLIDSLGIGPIIRFFDKKIFSR